MTVWVEFFRVLTRHRQGYALTMPYATAVDHPGQDGLPRLLYMTPLPTGHPIGLTTLAEEWISGGCAA